LIHQAGKALGAGASLKADGGGADARWSARLSGWYGLIDRGGLVDLVELIGLVGRVELVRLVGRQDEKVEWEK
jgi:hypothetical protein